MQTTITLRSIDRALGDVMRELGEAGLLTGRVGAVPVVAQAIDLAPFVLGYEGLYVEEPTTLDRLLGFEARTIYIPLTTFSRCAATLGLAKRQSSSLRDVLRHELGHAFAVEHPSLVRRSAAFVRGFGAPYDAGAYDASDDDFITPYASTSPAEDFAETFMVYLRHQGDIAKYRGRRLVYRKLLFVRALARAVV